MEEKRPREGRLVRNFEAVPLPWRLDSADKQPSSIAAALVKLLSQSNQDRFLLIPQFRNKASLDYVY